MSYLKCRQFEIQDKEMLILIGFLMGEKRNAYRILVGNPEGKRPLGRPRRRWVDILKLILER
jgi:hypothetical protein